MEKVLVLGNCGAGKSTFASKLSQRTGLPVISLDEHYWQPAWQRPHPEAWRRTVQTLAARPSWIMDGNYKGTLDIRIPHADTIIFLDRPASLCLWRITKRTLRHWGRVRPGMPPDCRERFDLDFYRYVATFNRKHRQNLLARVNAVNVATRLTILHTDADANAFLTEC